MWEDLKGGKGKENYVIVLSSQKIKAGKLKKIVLVTFACDVCGMPVL